MHKCVVQRRERRLTEETRGCHRNLALNCRSEGSVEGREVESLLKREVDQLVDDNNAIVKESNSVGFQYCSFVISKDLKFC